MIFDHYRQLVQPKEAVRYWKICPPSNASRKIIPITAAA
jgi:hypothetical protein